MDSVNFIDLLALLILGVAIYFGWRSGFVIQALALAGFAAGIVLIVVAAPAAANALASVDPWLRSVIIISAIAGIVLVAQGVGSSLGSSVRRRMGNGMIGGVDTGAGAAFGLLRGLFLVWLMGGLAAALPMPGIATEARQSAIVHELDSRLPSPVILAAQLGRLIESTGLPEVFVGAPPPAELPTGGPTSAEAAQIAAAARASTVRVEAIACGNFVSGSGFAVAGDRFITNAHVVAGSTEVWLSFDGSLQRHHAYVVLFDSSLDAAVLAIDAPLNVRPLTLSSHLPQRGDYAAALGYTSGGPLRLVPAVVSRSVEALGRDIYGTQIVARDVVEMRADVAPGDSGGPLLLADGTVGGVTFSESRTQSEIGYALSPVDVGNDLARAAAVKAPVDTGACLADP